MNATERLPALGITWLPVPQHLVEIALHRSPPCESRPQGPSCVEVLDGRSERQQLRMLLQPHAFESRDRVPQLSDGGRIGRGIQDDVQGLPSRVERGDLHRPIDARRDPQQPLRVELVL